MGKRPELIEQLDAYVPGLVPGARLHLLVEGTKEDAYRAARTARPSLARHCEDGLWRAWKMLTGDPR